MKRAANYETVVDSAAVPAMMIVHPLLDTVAAMCAALMIFGAVKSRHTLLLPWMTYYALAAASYFVGFIFSCILGEATLIVIALISNFLVIYFWLTVYSHFMQLKTAKLQTNPYVQLTPVVEP